MKELREFTRGVRAAGLSRAYFASGRRAEQFVKLLEQNKRVYDFDFRPIPRGWRVIWASH